MSVQFSTEDLLLLKDKVFHAAEDNQAQVIQDCLASLHPDVVKDVLHHCSFYDESESTPLIIAAWNRHLEVVELLVNEFNVDVNQKVLSSFESHHALISAVWKGHLDIVKVLVKKGCDISAASRDTETAVSVACDLNRLDILKYLVENGAQVNDHALTDSQTYLSTACLNGNREMMAYLLSKGADPNIQDEDGGTVLHQAAKRDAPDMIRLLLRYGATFTKDKYGRSPLMQAAMNACSHSVEILLDSVDLSQLERIEGLEVLGATLALRNVDHAFEYMRQAIEERHKDPDNVLLKPHSLLPTLSNVQESQTLDELQARQSNQHLFHLECLAILNRILGPDHYFTTSWLNDYHRLLESTGRLSEATTVFLIGLKAAVKASTKPFFLSLVFHFLPYRIIVVLPNIGPSSFSSLCEIVESTFEMMEKYESFKYENFPNDDVLLSYLLLALKVAQGQEEGRRLQSMTERFFRLWSGFPVLHKAVGLNWIRPDFLKGEKGLPFDLLVSFLLQCGADVHIRDDSKNTALHTVARISQRGKDSGLVSRIARTLLDAGALVGVKNNKGETPLDLAGPVLAAELRELYPVSLKSLAATVVVEHKIPYVGEVPEDLAEFTEKH